MEKTVERESHRKCDAELITRLKEGDKEGIERFFYEEILGILKRIQSKIFQGRVELDDLMIELYLYLNENNWRRLDCFDGRNNCRLRTWMIPVAWRFFVVKRYTFDEIKSADNRLFPLSAYSDDELRIQIAIDVNAVLDRMPNKRYSEILRLLIIEGYAASDVADMLNLKVDNVYNFKHRAIKQFIKLYGK